MSTFGQVLNDVRRALGGAEREFEPARFGEDQEQDRRIASFLGWDEPWPRARTA
jgi:hypothetical protein